jgi:hypothetical protein
MITKHVLNPEAKKKCDALSVGERTRIIEKIEAMEKKTILQMEHLQVLKLYYTEVNEKEKDVYGKGKGKGYKYNTQ